MTRFVMISDTHERHEQLGTLPEGDVLVHSGDFTIDGTRQYVIDFLQWFESQPHALKILVAGNHDISFETKPEVSAELREKFAPSVIYLEDASVVCGDLLIYGSPWTPEFMGGWNFHKPKRDMHTVWDKIPTDVDVLITHGPPFGILDLTREGSNAGCEELRERIEQLPFLKLHVFGHIHEGHGVISKPDGRIFVNASSCQRNINLPFYEPIVVDI